jgi:hypothetical protein
MNYELEVLEFIKKHNFKSDDIPSIINILMNYAIEEAIFRDKIIMKLYNNLQMILCMQHIEAERKNNILEVASQNMLTETKQRNGKNGENIELWTIYPIIRILFNKLEFQDGSNATRKKFKRFCELFKKDLNSNIEHAKEMFTSYFGTKADELWLNKLKKFLLKGN